MPVTSINRPLRLPRIAFLTAWELQGLGEPHPVVGVNDLYLTDEIRVDLRRRTLARLTDLGLATPNGLQPPLARTLAMLASATHEFYAWSSFRNGDAGAILVARHGYEAVRLITDGNVVYLDPIDADQLAQRFVETLPNVPGARVPSIMVPKKVYSGDYGGNPDDPLAEPSAAEQQATRLRELMRAERDALHQIYAVVRDGNGNRRRSVPISAVDLSRSGRVVTFRSGGGRAEETINLVPGAPAQLISLLNATIAGL